MRFFTIGCSIPAIIFFLNLFHIFDCKKYDKCELARELYDKYQFPLTDISKWLCLVQWESAYDTGAVNKSPVPNSLDYGIFQINDNKWCKSMLKPSQNKCGMPCERFRDDNIADDVQCVKTMMTQSNFHEWMSYGLRCQSNTAQYIEGCDMTSRATRVRVGIKFNPIPKSVLKLGLRFTDNPKGLKVNVVPPAVRFNLITKLLESKLLGHLRIKPFFSMHQYVTK